MRIMVGKNGLALFLACLGRPVCVLGSGFSNREGGMEGLGGQAGGSRVTVNAARVVLKLAFMCVYTALCYY